MHDQPIRWLTTPVLVETFDDVVLPHLDVAYRLARWLMRIDRTHKTSCRRRRYGPSDTSGHLRAETAVPGAFRIVRNTCSGWRGRRFEALTIRSMSGNTSAVGRRPIQETLLLQTDDASLIARAMRNLPDRFHQLLVLRELEGLSYREMADVMGIPMGTVMSDPVARPSGASRRPRGRAQAVWRFSENAR